MHIVGADDPVRPVPLSFRTSARTGVEIRFPLPPSAREVAARRVDGGSDIARQFLSPSRLRRQPPPSGGLAAWRCRADGTSYPKGICSAALHCRTPSPTEHRRDKCAPCGGTHGSRPTECGAERAGRVVRPYARLSVAFHAGRRGRRPLRDGYQGIPRGTSRTVSPTKSAAKRTTHCIITY